MGVGASRRTNSGILPGATAAPIATTNLTPRPQVLYPDTRFKVTVPDGKKTGDTMLVDLRGKPAQIKIPSGGGSNKNVLRAGDTFICTHPAETSKVIASSLHAIPGMDIIQAKPMLWATTSVAYGAGGGSQPSKVGKLFEAAQEELLRKTIDVGCNAALGINVNITTDSWGDRGGNKIVMVTVCGTPCSVVPKQGARQEEPPIAVADAAIVEPSYHRQEDAAILLGSDS